MLAEEAPAQVGRRIASSGLERSEVCHEEIDGRKNRQSDLLPNIYTRSGEKNFVLISISNSLLKSIW